MIFSLINSYAIAKEAAEYFKRELPGVIYKTGKIPEISHTQLKRILK